MNSKDAARPYLDFGELDGKARYKLLCALVIPRPIAWVTTRSAAGTVNAAPFSFFNVFSEDPPLLILGLQHREAGRLKDTTTNIRETGEFVVNIVRESMFEDMVASAAVLDADIGEPALLGLETVPGRAVDVPHLKASPAAIECRHERTLSVSPHRDIVVGEVVGLWFEDGLIDRENHYVDWKDDLPVGRLFGNSYSRTREAVDLRRPTPAAETVLARADRTDAGRDADGGNRPATAQDITGDPETCQPS